jgi:hypothetical protein
VVVWSSQLAANDFPPVCAMTGQPAETWRKFRFSTAPAWWPLLLLLLCTGFGLLIVFIALYGVSRRASGHLPLTRASSRRVALAAWLPAGIFGAGVVLVILGFVIFGASSTSTRQVTSALVYTTWVADAGALGGPEPGYKPALSSLTGTHVTQVSAAKDTSGDTWDLEVILDSTGTQLMSAMTRDNVAACPDSSANPECAQRHLAMWVGLTQSDIDNWEDLVRANNVSRPVGAGCDVQTAPGASCAKLVIDALTTAEIDSGDIAISGFTQKEAQDLVNAIQPASSTTSPVGSVIGYILLSLGALALLGGLVGAVVLRRLIGPRAEVREQPPGYPDKPVELRHVHPGFVWAVQQAQQARAAQYVPSYPPPMASPPSPQLPPPPN